MISASAIGEPAYFASLHDMAADRESGGAAVLIGYGAEPGRSVPVRGSAGSLSQATMAAPALEVRVRPGGWRRDRTALIRSFNLPVDTLRGVV